VNRGLASWRAITKSPASTLLAFVFVVAAVFVVHIVTSRTYSFKVQLGPNQAGLELTPGDSPGHPQLP
jgi:hypothetical protein